MTTFDDNTWDAMEGDLDATIIRWRPEPGDRVMGEVLDIRYTNGKHGTFGTVCIRTREGQLVDVVATHTTLRNKLTEAKAQPGDLIGVKYLGETPKMDNSGTYFDYNVIRRGDEPRRPSEVFDPGSNSGDDDLGLLPDVT